MNSDNKNVDRKKEDQRLIYELDGRPRLRTAVPLGMQHILAMFTSNLAPILIIAGACSLSGADTVLMMQCAMFVSGLTTFVQLYPIKIGKFQIGSRLPIVMGTSFAFVPTATTIAATGGLGAVLGGSLVGSLTEVFMGFFYKYIRRFFPPTGCWEYPDHHRGEPAQGRCQLLCRRCGFSNLWFGPEPGGGLLRLYRHYPTPTLW